MEEKVQNDNYYLFDKMNEILESLTSTEIEESTFNCDSTSKCPSREKEIVNNFISTSKEIYQKIVLDTGFIILVGDNYDKLDFELSNFVNLPMHGDADPNNYKKLPFMDA